MIHYTEDILSKPINLEMAHFPKVGLNLDAMRIWTLTFAAWCVVYGILTVP